MAENLGTRCPLTKRSKIDALIRFFKPFLRFEWKARAFPPSGLHVHSASHS